MEPVRRPLLMMGRPTVIDIRTGREVRPPTAQAELVPVKEKPTTMSGSLLNLRKVIHTGENINPRIKGSIVFHIKGEGYFFVDEAIFKEKLIYLLDKPDVVKQLTNMQANEQAFDEIVASDKLRFEPYSIKDPSIPDDIVPMVF